MKKALCLMLILALCLALTACAVAEPPPAPEPEPEALDEPPKAEPAYEIGENEFRLDSLPELAAFEPFTDHYSRYYDEYMDHLLPRDDYGTLYPFIGDMIGQDYFQQNRYGFCDSQGRIVVDAVYQNVYRQEDEGAGEFYICYGPPVILSDGSEDGEYPQYYEPITIMRTDGSWALQDVPGYLYAADGQAIILNGNVTDWDLGYGVGYREIYIYTLDGELRTTLHDAVILGYANGLLSIGEPDGKGGEEPVERVVDLDGNTVEHLGSFTAAHYSGDYVIAQDENDGWGFVDKDGQFIDERRWSWIYYDPWNKIYEYDSPFDNLNASGFLDENGELLYEYEHGDTWARLERDRYTDELIVRVSERNADKSKLINLDTGEESADWQRESFSLNFIGNGWYAATDRSDTPSVMLMRWGDELPRYTFEGENHLWLHEPEGRVAVIGYESREENDHHEIAILFDLEAGEEIARFDRYSYGGYCEGLGYMLSSQSDNWSYNVCDMEGNLIFRDNYRHIEALGDGLYSVSNDIYAGIINEEEEWLIRFCIVSND